jgi:hypothetical protein
VADGAKPTHLNNMLTVYFHTTLLTKEIKNFVLRTAYCLQYCKVMPKIQDSSVKAQLYYLTNELHVSTKVRSHHQADPENIKEKNHAVAILMIATDHSRKHFADMLNSATVFRLR